jgi:natural product precursor
MEKIYLKRISERLNEKEMKNVVGGFYDENTPAWCVTTLKKCKLQSDCGGKICVLCDYDNIRRCW